MVYLIYFILLLLYFWWGMELLMVRTKGKWKCERRIFKKVLSGYILTNIKWYISRRESYPIERVLNVLLEDVLMCQSISQCVQKSCSPSPYPSQQFECLSIFFPHPFLIPKIHWNFLFTASIIMDTRK